MSANRYTSKADYATMWERQKGLCGNPKCRKPLVKGDIIKEHIQPCSRGGKNTLANKKLHCRECANEKTFHPRSKATTLGGDNFEFHKTNRLKRGPRKRKGREIRSHGFQTPTVKKQWPKRQMRRTP